MIAAPPTTLRRAAAPTAPTRTSAVHTAALIYRSGEKCPGCWGTHFYLGRTTAECANCGMALALDARDARP